MCVPGFDVYVHHVNVHFVPGHEAFAANVASVGLFGVAAMNDQLVRAELLLVLAHVSAL